MKDKIKFKTFDVHFDTQMSSVLQIFVVSKIFPQYDCQSIYSGYLFIKDKAVPNWRVFEKLCESHFKFLDKLEKSRG